MSVKNRAKDTRDMKIKYRRARDRMTGVAVGETLFFTMGRVLVISK